MDPILYVETNFAVAVAKGQDPLAARFLEEAFPQTQVLVPAVCFMEAFSVLEEERKERNRFKDSLPRRSAEAKRDQASSHASELVKHLGQALIESDELLNEIRLRLHDVLDGLSSNAEVIGLDAR